MNVEKTVLLFFTAFLSCVAAYSENVVSDTLKVGEAVEKSDRNVELNAEQASVPRELNIGFAGSGKGAMVGINDMRHAYALPGRSQYHWAGGNAFEPLATYTLVESAVRFGEISIMMDSKTKFGGDELSGAFTGTTSSNGLIRFDGAVGGPINKAKGWYFSGSAYVNLDPTNVNSPSRKYIDNKQILMGTVSKRWKRSSLDFVYSLAFNRDNVENGYAQAPFLYNGDGSISAIPGFRIGRDSYMPVDESVSYMDLRTGKMVNTNIGDTDRRQIHDVYAIFKHNALSGWMYTVSGHLCYMPIGHGAIAYVKGIDKVDAKAGFTNPDGSVFSGYLQNRMVLSDDTKGTTAEISLKAERKFARHKLQLSTQPHYSYQMECGSTYMFAHTVAANPTRIYKNGKSTWSYNTASIYYSTDSYTVPVVLYDDWTPARHWLFRTGLRVCPTLYFYQCYTKGDDGINARVDGFNLADPKLARMDDKTLFGVNWAVSEHVSYNIIGRLFAMAEGFVSSTAKSPQFFKNPSLPSMIPIGNAFGRGGLMYDNEWMDIAALFSYITNWNATQAIQVSKKLASGLTETIPYTAQYGIGTPGVTIDGNVHFGGFKLHALATWQDPRYKNYRCEFNFSDGSKEVIDYTGKYVTGISQWMFEFDPSYQFKTVRLWASLRYNSRQYASRTNLAYFNGHFETFAGVDVNVNKNSRIALNIVNVLGQTGAKGSIDSVDTVTDPAQLQNLLISGTYIRPLSIELAYTYKF